MRGSAHVPTGFGRAKVHSMLQLLSLGETSSTTACTFHNMDGITAANEASRRLE